MTQLEQIVITAEDYERFDKKYELIRAQLLSLFIHHPIIFMGYTITDENIRAILQTIFHMSIMNRMKRRKYVTISC